MADMYSCNLFDLYVGQTAAIWRDILLLTLYLLNANVRALQ